MKAILNRRSFEPPVNCATLGDLLDSVQSQLPAGHIVWRIVVDGQELQADSEQAAMERACAGIGEVEFTSISAVELAREGLRRAVHSLPELAGGLREAGGALRTGNTDVGLDLLYDALGELEWYVGLIDALDVYFSELTQEFDLPPDTESGLGVGKPVREMRTFSSVNSLRDKLVEVQRLQRQHQFTSLADVLDNELAPLVKMWIHEAPQLLRRVNSEGAVA